MKIPFVHVINGDEVAFPRRGLIIRNYGEFGVSVSLVLGWVGGSRRLFFFDYNNLVGMSRPFWWMCLHVDVGKTTAGRYVIARPGFKSGTSAYDPPGEPTLRKAIICE
jgi:hypothetical protein